MRLQSAVGVQPSSILDLGWKPKVFVVVPRQPSGLKSEVGAEVACILANSSGYKNKADCKEVYEKLTPLHTSHIYYLNKNCKHEFMASIASFMSSSIHDVH